MNANTHLPVPNPNGTLELGEAAKIGISVVFSPIGTVVQLASGPATVAGFARTGFGLGVSTFGSWSDLQVAPGFVGEPLLPASPDGMVKSVWQPHPPLGTFPVATNPIPSLWSVAWVPLLFSPPRSVTCGLSTLFDDYPNLFVRTGVDPQGNPLFGTVEPLYDWGANLNIPIAPAPSIPSAVVLASVFAARRRRPGQTSC